jgi:hypothetical protein
MDALRSVSSGSFGQKQENGIPSDKKNVNGSQEEKKIILERDTDKVEENDDQCINILISRKAYNALKKFTKELNQGESSNKKPYTVEEVLDEEILLLFSDEWQKKT